MTIALLKSIAAPAKPETSTIIHFPAKQDTLPAKPGGKREWESLPVADRDLATQRLEFVRAVLDLAGRDGVSQEAACEAVRARHGERFPLLLNSGKGGRSALSYHNFRSWKKQLTIRGRVNLDSALPLVNHYKGGRKSMIETGTGRQFLQLFSQAYENQNRLPMEEAYRAACILAKGMGMDMSGVPSLRAIRHHYENKVDQVSVLQARHGREWAENHLAGYITRDWSTVEVGELWIGDHHVFDAPVRVWDEKTEKWKAVRPWLTGWLDARSRYMVGWIIRAGEHPDSLAIEDALLNGIVASGGRPPACCYTDNGKDYLARGFADPLVTPDGTEHSILRELGIRHITALPYNARSKTIERSFKEVAGSFARYWKAYLGNRPGTRPEAAVEMWKNPETLPTLGQFCEAFAWWLENIAHKEFGKASRATGGRSPAEMFGSATPPRAPWEKERLFRAFLRPVAVRKVDRGGRIRFDKLEFQTPDLWEHVGDQVLVKIDRYDSARLYIHDLAGGMMAEAKRVEALPVLNADPDKLSAMMAEHRRMLSHARERHLERTGGKRMGPLASRLELVEGGIEHDDLDDRLVEAARAASLGMPVEQPAAGPEVDPEDVKLLEKLRLGGFDDEETGSAVSESDLALLASLKDD